MGPASSVKVHSRRALEEMLARKVVVERLVTDANDGWEMSQLDQNRSKSKSIIKARSDSRKIHFVALEKRQAGDPPARSKQVRVRLHDVPPVSCVER